MPGRLKAGPTHCLQTVDLPWWRRRFRLRIFLAVYEGQASPVRRLCQSASNTPAATQGVWFLREQQPAPCP
jgi:hypothetical protein